MWKRIAYALAILVITPVALWFLSRWMGASPTDRAALALMEKPWQPAGRNAFPQLWLAAYPIPSAEIDAVMATDLRKFAARPNPVAVPSGQAVHVQAFESSAKTGWPDDAVPARTCQPDGKSCLEYVRANLPALRTWAGAARSRMERIEQASSGDYLRPLFPSRIDAPLVDLRILQEPATAYALRFVEGDQAGALASTCARASDWKRLRPQSGMLIYSMSANRLRNTYNLLAAEMLAELPADAELPAECGVAFSVPLPAEASLCTAMRGEFTYIRQMHEGDLEARFNVDGLSSKDAGGFYHPGTTRALIASRFSPFCEPANEQRLARDEPMPTPAPAGPWRLVCVANAAGCMFAGMSGDQFGQFADQVRNQVALSRLMAGMLWLRGQPALLAAPERIVAELPAQFRSAGHPLRYDAEGRSLVMQLAVPQGETRSWAIPLPGSRLARTTP